MPRRIQDAVLPDYSISVLPEKFATDLPRTTVEATRLLDGLRPTSGNLAASEAWRRIVGGRSRHNKQKQAVAKARRKAILGWLMRTRMYFWCEPLKATVRIDRIIVRHGDGAMLARALGVGKATICRDLSALQAVHPALFGKRHCAGDYEEYMAGWRYAHRSEMGNEQPHHNLRFPRNQNGAKARTTRLVAAELSHNAAPAGDSHSVNADRSLDRETGLTTSDTLSTTRDFLSILDRECPENDLPQPTELERCFIHQTISA